MGVEAAPQDLSRNHTGSFIGLELKDDAALQLRTSIVGALTLTVSQLVAETVNERAGGCTAAHRNRGAGDAISRQVAFAGHNDRKFRRQLEVARPAQFLNEPESELW